MSERDLDKFIEKVSQLQRMVKSLDEDPERRKLLTKCETHDQVIALAREWGYEIGNRWGES